jgi:DNA gyrase/topoisomerase IV subunit A
MVQNNQIKNRNKNIQYKEIDIQRKKLFELNNELNKAKKLIESLQKKITQQEQEIIKLRSELKDKDIDFSNFSKNEIIFNDEEKIKIHFSSLDQNINISLLCTNYEIFAEVEEKLYQKFPEYRETNNCFFSNGTQILRFKTIEENKLENNKSVILVVPSEEDKLDNLNEA